MSKEKITLTLDTDNLRELRALVGSRSLSETVDTALAAHLTRVRHLRAVDGWLRDMERKHGPVPERTRTWAAGVVTDWESRVQRRRRKTG